ncbi:I66 family serine proteinase inhibitor [Kitasatospora sp. NPDC097643]|uniref:I66 family serine proteinase inhibitor n=1 Tax=Kitasatospora sp. NPDC097643 TaxID=3157230 RepID=UPI003330ECC3
MSLGTGLYTIRSGDAVVGRALREPFTLSPKPVFSLTDDEDAAWAVEALPNERYQLYAKGAPAGVEGDRADGSLVAYLIDQTSAEEWLLVPVAGVEGAYQVVAPNGAAWTVTRAGEYGRVAVRPVDGAPAATHFTFTSAA